MVTINQCVRLSSKTIGTAKVFGTVSAGHGKDRDCIPLFQRQRKKEKLLKSNMQRQAKYQQKCDDCCVI